MKDTQKGFIFALIAFTGWGFFPLFWKALAAVPSLELTHIRILFSLVTLVIFFAFKKQWPLNLNILRNPKELAINALASLLVAVNWFVFIYAISIGRTFEGSLGYFASPIMSVLLGVIVLKEKLRAAQKISAIIALIGLCFYIKDLSSFPIIAFALASSFALYGLCRKFSKISSLKAVFLETLLIAPISLYAVTVFLKTPEALIIDDLNPFQWVCLTLTGVVTLIPLISYKKSCEYLPLATVGLLQYLAPILQLFCSFVIIKENVDTKTLIFLVFIIIASFITIIEGVNKHFTTQKVKI